MLASACGSPSPEARTPGALATLRPGGLSDATPATFEATRRSLKGMPLVVNFWASWCVPCKQEMPRIVEAARRLEGSVRFLGIDVEDAEGPANQFLAEYDVPFASLADRKGEIRRSERIVGLPTTQFYRADGELAFQHSGEIKQDQLDEKLKELIRFGTPSRDGK